MSTTAEEIWELLGELIKAQKETDRLLREQSQETNRKFQETDRLLREQSQEMKLLIISINKEKIRCCQSPNFQPFDVGRFIEALPNSVKSIAVLDRTKEPGTVGEPLYLQVVTAIHEKSNINQGGETIAPDIVYPESDGKPMADNTKQFCVIFLPRWFLKFCLPVIVKVR